MADPGQISKIWQTAIRRYEDTTERKLDNSSLTSLNTVDELRKTIDSQNQSFDAFRKKRHGLYAVLSASMGPIELVGSAAVQAAANVFPASSYIFAGVQYLIGAAKGVSENYDAIEDVLSTLKDFTERLQNYAGHLMSNGLENKLAEILAVILEILAICEKEMKHRHARLLAFGKSLIQTPDEGKEALQKLNKLFDGEKGLVGAETWSAVKGVAATVNRLEDDVSAMTQAMNTLATNAAQDQGPSRKLRTILQPSGISEDRYQALKRSRVPDTAVWIRDEPIFKAWLAGEESIIWISGNPGAGKSHLATSVITDLIEADAEGGRGAPDISVGYFFFKDDDPRTRSFHQALRDIAYLISQDDHAYAKHILATCYSPEDISTLSRAWRNLFETFFIDENTADTPPPKSKAFIVLDGLDEANEDERRDFFELAKAVNLSGRIHVAMFGRPQVIDEIETCLEMPGVPTIHVTAESNSQDISRYIQSTISKSVYLKKAPKTLLQEIIEELSSKAQGMFIWVNLMLQTISKIKNVPAIRKALREAPRGLHEMIRHVLEGFSASLRDSPDDVRDLNEMLAWVTCTARPLTLAEIDNVLKWKSDSGEGVLGLERSLRTQFASFFALVREDNLETADLYRHRLLRIASVGSNEDAGLGSAGEAEEDLDEAEDEFDSNFSTTTVTFSHASIGDFFRSEKEGPVLGEGATLSVGVDIKKARVEVLRSCLDVISCEPGSSKQSIAGKLREYAVSAWLDLLQEIDITKTSDEDKAVVAHCLMSALTKDTGISRVDTKLQLLKRSSLDLLKLWFEKSTSPDVKAWYSEKTVENDADLLDGVIRRVGKRWLSTEDSGWLSDVRVLAAYMTFRAGEEPKLAIPPAEDVIACADWLSLEKNALWYRKLGATLRDLGHYTEALKQIEQAAALTPKLEQWPIRHTKSWVYVEMRQYETAVELDIEILGELEALCEKSDATEPKKWYPDLHKVSSRLVFCYRELKKEEEELASLEKATMYDTRDYSSLQRFIALLWARGRVTDVTAALQRIDKKLPDKEYTGLIEALLTNRWCVENIDDFRYIAVSALKAGVLPWLIEAYQNAMQAANKERSTVVSVNLEMSLAFIYDKGGLAREEGIKIYRRVLDAYATVPADVALIASLANARYCLGVCILCRAIDVGPLSEEGQACGRELEALVARKQRLVVDKDVPSYASRELNMELYVKAFVKTSTAFMVQELCRLFLGNFYKLAGRMQDAMSQYTEVIKGCLEVLENDDLADDFSAFEAIFKTLAVASGPDDAVAVLYLAWAQRAEFRQAWAERIESQRRQHEGSRAAWLEQAKALPNTTPREETDEAPKKAEDAPQTMKWELDSVSCDACWSDYKPGEWEKHYFCYYCVFSICSKCHTELRSNTYVGAGCSPKHDWYMMPVPSDELMKNWQVGKLFVRGEWVDVGEWKNSLRKRFLEK